MSEFRFSPRPNRAAEIPWLTWSPAAFDRAKRESKPVLLSISAVWCHWCHVMDETSYSDPEVIETISRRFVPVRVDNDERPDVNARYNMGGWPTTAFLSDEGAALTGATYLPPAQMREVLDEVANWYAQHREEIAARVADASTHPRAGDASAREANIQDVEALIAAVVASFDEAYAGFGDAPKFPQPELLETLLVESQATGDERLRAMVVRTLLAMSRGGMYDHVEGGFFRYSTTRDWSVPHFEKMAEDHAGLIRVLAMLLQRAPHSDLHATLRSAVDYVANVLLDPATGFFAGSQDADESYYALPLEERRATAAPFVDRTLYADRNAGLAGALLAAGAALEDDRILGIGVRALDALHEHMLDADELLYHVRRQGESPAVRGLLGDQSAYLRALLDAHEISGEARFLERARTLATAVVEHFQSEEGGFYDHAAIETTLGRLALRDRPIVENSVLAETLLRLADLASEERYREIAERALGVYASSFVNAGAFAAAYARASRRLLTPSVSVRIVGSVQEGADFRETARRLPSPYVSVRSLASSQAPALDLPATPSPAAYVCAGRTCGPPAASAAELRAAYDAILA